VRQAIHAQTKKFTFLPKHKVSHR